MIFFKNAEGLFPGQAFVSFSARIGDPLKLPAARYAGSSYSIYELLKTSRGPSTRKNLVAWSRAAGECARCQIHSTRNASADSLRSFTRFVTAVISVNDSRMPRAI